MLDLLYRHFDLMQNMCLEGMENCLKVLEQCLKVLEWYL